MNRSTNRASLATALAVGLLVAACGGPAAPGDPTPGPATIPPATAAPTTSAAPSETSTPVETQGPTGPANIDGPETVEAGADFEVAWTGPNGDRDYVTIVEAGAAEWTNESYFYTIDGSPGSLTAPSAPGAYALWYVSGVDKTILARVAISVTPFQGALLAPESVVGNTTFEVAWNGPNGSGDYVTIVKAGATKWTNEDYFYTTAGSPGELLAPIEAGTYEIWYVIGSDSTIQARRPIIVTAAEATVDGPDQVQRDATFSASWSGPNGPGDYITIVPVGSANTVYGSYFYTYVGPSGELVAPATAGSYELRYVTGQGSVVLATVPIKVN